MTRFPQILVNVEVTNEGKLRFYTDRKIKEVVQRVQNQLGRKGRILVRPSGTEPLLRVMVEGENGEEIKELANFVADVIREQLI